MSAPAFTPGPWSAAQAKASAAFTVFDDRNGSLATVWDATWMGRKYDPEANARLIAAAPELYETAFAFLLAWGGAETEEETAPLAIALGRALRKARGEQ